MLLAVLGGISQHLASIQVSDHPDSKISTNFWNPLLSPPRNAIEWSIPGQYLTLKKLIHNEGNIVVFPLRFRITLHVQSWQMVSSLFPTFFISASLVCNAIAHLELTRTSAKHLVLRNDDRCSPGTYSKTQGTPPCYDCLAGTYSKGHPFFLYVTSKT